MTISHFPIGSPYRFAIPTFLMDTSVPCVKKAPGLCERRRKASLNSAGSFPPSLARMFVQRYLTDMLEPVEEPVMEMPHGKYWLSATPLIVLMVDSTDLNTAFFVVGSV